MEIISSKIFHLAECPFWNVREQSLYWTDILNGEIWKYEVKTGKSKLIWKGDMLVGGFAFDKNNNLILCSDKGVFRLKQAGDINRKPEIVFEIPFDKDERFNDITTDPAGRIFAGTKSGDNRNGKLWRLEKNKQPEVVLHHLGISNGMTFSLDHNFFYHTDSAECTIKKYKYDVETGKISNPRIFYKGEPLKGFPDGITLDSKGFLWVAFWGASCIRRISQDGEIIQEIKVPAIQPSSLMFGGGDLRSLFITSACEGGADIQKGLDKNGNFLGGHVFRTEINIKGRPEWYANI